NLFASEFTAKSDAYQIVFQEVATYTGEERASPSMLFNLGVLVVPISELSEIIEASKNKGRSHSRIKTRVRIPLGPPNRTPCGPPAIQAKPLFIERADKHLQQLG
ncbi:MAG: hypothetical protein ACXWWI_06910, partial [Nitrospira sp.]